MIQDKISPEALITGAITACASGILWLVRRVITNQKQIELLQSEITHRDKQRSEDRESLHRDLSEIKDDVRVLRASLKQ